MPGCSCCSAAHASCSMVSVGEDELLQYPEFCGLLKRLKEHHLAEDGSLILRHVFQELQEERHAEREVAVRFYVAEVLHNEVLELLEQYGDVLAEHAEYKEHMLSSDQSLRHLLAKAGLHSQPTIYNTLEILLLLADTSQGIQLTQGLLGIRPQNEKYGRRCGRHDDQHMKGVNRLHHVEITSSPAPFQGSDYTLLGVTEQALQAETKFKVPLAKISMTSQATLASEVEGRLEERIKDLMSLQSPRQGDSQQKGMLISFSRSPHHGTEGVGQQLAESLGNSMKWLEETELYGIPRMYQAVQDQSQGYCQLLEQISKTLINISCNFRLEQQHDHV
eukprot:SM000053S17478  [mRNA]  locus=s53:692804:695304:+ [translate_table: standard]